MLSFACKLQAAHNACMQRLILTLVTSVALAGCATSAGIGIGVPVGPVSVGVGLGSGGVSAGVGTGVGPVGVGVGVNQRGQVTGSAGVGASVPVGEARVGAGVGTSTVLHDPAVPANTRQYSEPVAPAAGSGQTQWRNSHGNFVPECRLLGNC